MTVFFAMVPDASGVDQPAFFLLQKQAPPAAVQISGQRHAELLQAMEDGKTIACGRGGKPKIEPLRIDDDALRTQLTASIKREAARRIEQIAPPWRQLNDMREHTPEGEERFAQIEVIRDASNQIESLLADVSSADLPDFPVQSNPLWPEF